MTNLIIASFKEDTQAIEASQKLNELETIGDITIYERVLVRKKADGTTELVQTDTTEGLTTLSGMTIGTLIGALAGPVGMLAGMLTGTLAGAAMEVDDYGFAEDFVSKAADHLQPGTIAIIAEVEEDNNIFIDDSLNPLGATLTRSEVNYELDKYSDEELDQLDEDIAEQRAKLKTAAADKKAKIDKKIADLKEKRKETLAEWKEKAKEAASDVKESVKDRKIARIRNKIEKHQKKISDLESKLQEAIGKQPEVQAAVH
ncbi:DUF1269 domain-containing protein [Puia dinghuensis]|uniref:DUF1269 domain-containing protein n=1 Tax=Puia dinghuensis TaxID=1792502 RepID=A0A8J2UJK8_9BACT|nr:DUF1269 domain-containing protein [Puia dinghuensis]GGB24324.1 hypothetical protein GCM10011511_55290 [Puia dinghuensis]